MAIKRGKFWKKTKQFPKGAWIISDNVNEGIELRKQIARLMMQAKREGLNSVQARKLIGTVIIGGRKKGFNNVTKYLTGKGNWSYKDVQKSADTKAIRRQQERIPESIKQEFLKKEKDGLLPKERGWEAYKEYIRKGNEANEEYARVLGKELGIDVHKGHMFSLSGDPDVTTKRSPLMGQGDSWTKGSNDPRSQVAESGKSNVSAGKLDEYTARAGIEMGLPRNWNESATYFMAGFDNAGLTQADLIEIGQGADINAVRSRRRIVEQLTGSGLYDYNDDVRVKGFVEEIDNKWRIDKAIEQSNNPQKWSQIYNPEVDDAQFSRLGPEAQIARSKEMGRFQVLESQATGGIRGFVGANKEAITKASKTLNAANMITMTGAQAASGNFIGAGVTGTIAAGSLTLQNNALVQKRIAKLIAERAGKSATKLNPLFDPFVSAIEAGGYFSEGKYDQAAIAAVSGALGWIPVAGDLIAGGLDALNTGIDISRMDFSRGEDIKNDIKLDPETKPKQSNINKFTGWADELDEINLRSLRNLK
jgi:hypothetical protein